MVKQTFSIPDMHCVNCVMRLEGLEDDLVGIQTIKASYHKQTLDVVYDETQLSEQVLRQAITELGYTIQS
jgi:copper chaperone CopZ